ncbi:MFS transporter [Paracraurococcus ruber]|nr:MFS transporter [Paracraurococcus ruber]
MDLPFPPAARAEGDASPWVLAACILGTSLAFIDGSVVNVALSALEQDLGAGPGELSWAVSAYLLPLGALILLGGAAGDHFGRRRLFLAGIAVFALASAACAAAPSMGWLLAARGLQGMGAAMLMPNSLGILGAGFRGEARGRAIGTWAAAGALTGAVGPVLGGWLVETLGWRSIFLVNLPIAATAAAIAWRHVPESRAAGGTARLDWLGGALATLGLGLMTWALTAAAEGMGLAPVLSAALAGGLLLGGFLRRQALLGARALIPLAMFGSAAFVGLTLLTFFLYGALGGLIVLLPYLLIRIEAWPAMQAGAALLPLPLLIGLGSPLMGKVTARHGGRLPLAIGAAVVALGFALLARVGPGGLDYPRMLLPTVLLVGLGMALCAAPLTTTVMASVDAAHTGTASGVNSAVARLGGLLATALLGFVFALDGAEAFLAGLRAAAWTGAACALVAAVSALVLIPPGIRPAESPPPAPRPIGFR